jgi:siroheme synthase
VTSEGEVYLVGAGPGAVELITVKGLDLLRRADTIVYDQLANPELLREAKPNATTSTWASRAATTRWSRTR